jgi:hypothetical protein
MAMTPPKYMGETKAVESLTNEMVAATRVAAANSS